MADLEPNNEREDDLEQKLIAAKPQEEGAPLTEIEQEMLLAYMRRELSGAQKFYVEERLCRFQTWLRARSDLFAQMGKGELLEPGEPLTKQEMELLLAYHRMEVDEQQRREIECKIHRYRTWYQAGALACDQVCEEEWERTFNEESEDQPPK